MRNQKPAEVTPLSLDDLEHARGGATRPLWSQVTVGLNPSHNYGMITDSYGANSNLQFDRANESLQRFNAPTHDGLYNPQGNDPSLTAGTVSRPGADWLPQPVDHGGNITMFHGDGYIINTTVNGQHMLNGTASRHLVVDLNPGGGIETLTLGQGQNGAALAQAAGGALFGPLLGPLIGQNASHFLNPGLGASAFPQLDAAQRAWLEGTPNPNLHAPQGITVEMGGALNAAIEGYRSMGAGQVTQGLSEQQSLVRDVAHQLNQDGPVHGYFGKSSLGGIYVVGPDGTRYFERDAATNQVVEKQIDPFGGVDHAIALESAKNMLPGDPIYQTGEIHAQQAQQADLQAANGMLAGDPIQQMGEIQAQQSYPPASMDYEAPSYAPPSLDYDTPSYTMPEHDAEPTYAPPSMDYESPLTYEL